jgi:hypothetical protein
MSQRYPVPAPPGTLTPAYVPVITYYGGAYGDDVAVSTANVTNDFAPKTQVEKAAIVGMPIAQDVTSPRGWIDPGEPYGPAPVSPADDPTITSLSPNTGVSGGAPIWVTITGTKFTPWSQVETGGVVTPYSRYVSPTRIDMLEDPRSTPGIVVVKVIDHGVKSNGSNFTFT